MGVVANLVVRVSASVKEFEKELAGLERSWGRTGQRLKNIGGDLTKGLTLPLAGVGVLAIKAASDFESSFAGVRKTVDGVVDAGGNLTAFGKDLQQKFRDLAKEIPISVNELNRIGESAGQLGIKSDSIIDFTKTIAAMGVATNLTTEQAADGMARFANITQMPQDKIGNLGSTIVELGNKLAATESEILEFGLRIAGAGEIVGLTEAQILGLGAAFSSVGVEAEAGGTAVQKALLAMNSAVNTGDGLEAFGRGSGMSGADFKKLFNADPGEAFARFVEGVGGAGKQGEQILKGVGFDDARQIRAFLSIAAAGDVLRTSLRLAGDEWVRNTALTKEAAQRYGTFESQLTLFKNRVNDVAITLGTRLIDALLRMEPSITRVLTAVADGVEWFSRLPQPVQTAAFAFGALLAALGPLTYVVGTIFSTGSALVGVLRNIGLFGGTAGKAATTAATGVGMLGRALSIFAAPVAIVTGIAAIGHELAELARRQSAAGTLPEWVKRTLGVNTAGIPQTGRRTGDIALPSPTDEVWGEGLPEAGQQMGNLLNQINVGMPTATAKVNEFDRAVTSLVDRVGGADVINAANQWVIAIKQIGGIGALTHDEFEQFSADIAKAVEKLKALGQEVPRTWAIIAQTIKQDEALLKTREALGASLQQIGLNRQQLLVPATPMSADVVGGLMQGPADLRPQPSAIDMWRGAAPSTEDGASVGNSLIDMGRNWGNAVKEGFSLGVGSLPHVILGALQGGGDVAKSVGASFGGQLGTSIGSFLIGDGKSGLGKFLAGGMGGMLGKTLGGAIGSIIPGLGSLLGSMIGPLIGKLAGKIWNGIQGWFGNDEEAREVNPARDAYLAKFGVAGTGEGSGFHNLAAKLTEITGEEGGGALFRALTQADTMAEYNAAVEAIEARLASVHTEATSGFEATTAAADGFNLSLQGSDEAIAKLGETQLAVVETMLKGFDTLMAKLQEFIDTLTLGRELLGEIQPQVGPLPGGGSMMTGEVDTPEGWQTLDVPSFANEGVVRKPTLALIGDAPGGEPEYVLRKSTVDALRRGTGDAGGAVTVNVGPIDINGNPADPALRQALAEAVLEGVEKGGRAFGKFRRLTLQVAGA